MNVSSNSCIVEFLKAAYRRGLDLIVKWGIKPRYPGHVSVPKNLGFSALKLGLQVQKMSSYCVLNLTVNCAYPFSYAKTELLLAIYTDSNHL